MAALTVRAAAPSVADAKDLAEVVTEEPRLSRYR
jgi:hypothetical protein